MVAGVKHLICLIREIKLSNAKVGKSQKRRKRAMAVSIAEIIILFSMVGAQVNIGIAWRAGLMGAAVIGLGLLARGIGVGLCLFGSRLNRKERFFVAVAYSPKATVQAAIGSAPLLAMRSAGMDTAPGELILAIAVLSIFLTAPTGAWAINLLGRRVLEIAPKSEHEAYDAAIESSPEE